MITNPIVEIHSPSARIRDVNIATRQTFLLKPREDFVHDLLDRDTRSVDYICICRHYKRRNSSRNIIVIPDGDFVALALCSTTLETHLRRSIYVELVGRIEENDRPNISPLDYYIAPRSALVKFL